MADIPKIVLTGGFLGAGKTSLILRAGRTLEARGLRVAVIMNDQDDELVDTAYAKVERFETKEVAGGCFCCRFAGMLERAKELREHEPDVIFAEPVGSCIDLAATILQPFRAYHSDVFIMAPLTVLVDPHLAQQVQEGKVSAPVAYLFKQQIREADLVCLTKCDLFPAPPPLPFPVDFHVSSRTGAGVEAWLGEVLNSGRVPGARLLDVDYEEYASAEAALGWLNLHTAIYLDRAASPSEVVGPLLDQLDGALTSAGITIAHLKLFDQTSGGYVMVSIRSNGDEAEPRGDLISERVFEHQLAVNLRAIGEPARLQAVVEEALAGIRGTVQVGHLRAFRPPAPKPEHRFSRAY